MEKEQYFWNSTSGTFGGHRFGEDVTEYFEDDLDRREKYLELGKITTKKPVDFNDAKQSELNVLRKTVETQKDEIADLKSKSKSPSKASKKLKDAELEIVDLKSQANTANTKIKELEADLDKATSPKVKK